ncbi:hypothetical protein [Burkholderia orbicola]|uniref:hypothetical protein n=1 Tax=Burkholderia orbicola TaxID=2978683 RepID=UPI003AF72175
MHTFLATVSGLLLLGVFLLFGELWSTSGPSLGVAAKAFVPVWFGVYRAGYGVREELPVLLIVFGVPAAIALPAAVLLQRT